MRIKFNSVISDLLTQEQLLMKKIEIAQIKKQIDMIATFLPDELLRLSEREVMQTHRYVGVLMMTQICGFTTLTEKYNKIGKGGIYRLTATMNAYIGALIETFYYYGADVLKFSGEILITLWKVKPDSSIYEILHEAIVCALALQQILGNFETEININLQLKLGITCGNMSFTIIGDSNAKNYFIIGDAITEAKEGVNMSNNGDTTIGPSAWAHILHERYETTPVENGFVKVWKVYYKPNETSKKKHFEDKQIEVIKLIDKHIALREMLHSRNKFESSLTMTKIIEHFVQSLPQRTEMKQAARYWKVNELRPFIIKPIQDQVDESQPVEYLTDMREVTVQCIKIIPSSLNESTIVDTLKEAYKVIYSISSVLLGVISKVVLFDKDMMFLVIFGLKSVRHEMESQNALRSGFKIKKALLEISGIIKVSIAITSGFIYCGVIGHPFRREYAIIGSAFNRAMKMTNTYIGTVSCDKKTFKFSRISSFYFFLLSAYRSRDADDVGQVFEYNEDAEGIEIPPKEITPLYGRDQEYNLVRAIIYGDNYFNGIRGVCFHGSEGLGKTAILHHCLDVLRETQSFNIAYILLTNSSKIPYFCVSRLYRQLYDNRTKLNNNDVPVILNVPRVLRDQHDYSNYASDDVAMRKYRVLKCFRDLILSSPRPTILFIDNIEHIDLQSWEIIDIVSSENVFRLVATGTFDAQNIDLKFKISLNSAIKLVEYLALDNKYIAAVTCQFLNVHGVPRYLVDLLAATCEGKPGYIQSCLLRLINERSLQFKLINVFEKNESKFVYPDLGFKQTDNILTIATFSDSYEKSKHEVLTIAAISLDLYDSLPPYHQLVIKTASVLGELFIRTLLVVALKYPAEGALAKVIQALFEDEIFDCGSRYINAHSINTKKICCVCYFEPDYFKTNKRSEIPNYAYCKIIHFKNRSIRQVAYDLLPDNQKKELHLMCTDVLEYMGHYCPKCIRQPTNAFVNFGRFKEILSYCNNLSQTQTQIITEDSNIGEIKECIRLGIQDKLGELSSQSLERVAINPKSYFSDRCNCLEILSRTYKSLIYHSESAGHLGKRIFFTMKYGQTLICLDDYHTAIEILVEASELCMVDAKMESAQISDAFRRLHMGKINFGLARAFTDLHQLRTAKNYLAIALRQYNIPSLAIIYKNFNAFLTRSYLVNSKRMKPIRYNNTLARNDLASCLSLCGKIFSLEGKWSLAKMACAYSVFIIKMINPTIPILYEVYCNAMDVYKHCDQGHVCEKLAKYVKRDIQINYANNNTEDLYSLTELMSNLFHMRYMSGDINGAIRLGYRILDISLQLFSQVPYDNIHMWLVTLLMYNFRLHDAFIVGSLIKNNIPHGSKMSFYYIMALIYILRTGFYLESVDNIMSYAKKHHWNKTKETITWMDYLFYSVIWTYYMDRGKYQLAKEWKFQCTFNRTNTTREVVIKTLVFTTEARIYLLLRGIRYNLPIESDEKLIKNYLKLLDFQTKRQYRVYRPCYYIYKAWYLKIKGKHRKAKKFMKKTRDLCEEQGNLLFQCWTNQIEHAWVTPLPRFNEIPMISIEDTVNLSVHEWSRLMRTLPIE